MCETVLLDGWPSSRSFLSGGEDVIQIHRQPLDCLNFELLGGGIK